MRRHFRERFEAKYIPEPNTGCWLWLGYLSPAKRGGGGYGAFWLNGKFKKAHMVSYELFRGQIPDGLELDHLCRVRSCVNPDHLEAVTRSENIKRGAGGSVTHCPSGHPYDIENTKIYQGRRYCRACNRADTRRRRRTKRRGALGDT